LTDPFPDLGTEAFAFDDIDFKEAGDQNVIHLCDPSFAIDPKVVKDGPVGLSLEVKIDMVGRFFFSVEAGAADGQFLL
jgi:hypothetical protein